MLAKPLLAPILTNDALTRGLADPEARILIEWLVEQAERFAGSPASEGEILHRVHKLCRRGRAIGRFVMLWCHHRQRGAACQLAAAERFPWPLPTDRLIDPCELMQGILDCEGLMS
ncbi:MAG TPA: hypothetical protein VFA18_10100 [Gemmataceae bacterium]|nr:hypothetical protein [Gemmataceae bacterium]